MNSSQMLYKISNLQYSIRMKEAENVNAKNAGDESNVELNNAALALLKNELATTVKEFNSIPIHSPATSAKGSRKLRWWQKLFQFQSRYQ